MTQKTESKPMVLMILRVAETHLRLFSGCHALKCSQIEAFPLFMSE